MLSKLVAQRESVLVDVAFAAIRRDRQQDGQDNYEPLHRPEGSPQHDQLVELDAAVG
jgi:hypothetical protein